MQVKEIMTKAVELVPPDLPLKEAAARMKTKNIGALPVGENDRLVGMVTDRDIAVRAVANGKDPQHTSVREAMTSKVNYCFEDQSLEEAGQMMKDKKIRRLLVLNRSKRLVGICSLGDLTAKSGDIKLGGDVLKAVVRTA